MTHPTPSDDVKTIRDALTGKYGRHPTPGPWIDDRRLHWHQPDTVVKKEGEDGYGRIMDVRMSDLGSFTCTVGKSEQEWVNATYIAACYPERIARLIAHMDAQAEDLRIAKQSEREGWRYADELKRELDAQALRLEAAERDAARYQHVRANCASLWINGRHWLWDDDVGEKRLDGLIDDELTSTQRAAIASKAGK